MLHHAWYVGNVNYELYAYELLGKIFFYLEDIEKAKFFHNKMISGKLESKNSPAY